MGKQIYYHFLSSQFAINDLEERRIKVGTLDDLNDPFELEPYLRLPFEERQPLHEIRDRLSKTYGLLCFAPDWKQTLLWSHYADGHKGVAIGFEVLRDEEEVFEVEYAEDPIRRKIQLTGVHETDEKLFLDLARVKYKEWHYEKESRILVKLEPEMRVHMTCPDRDYYFLSFADGLKVTEIVFGCKFNDEREKGKIKNLAGQFGAKITYTRPEWQGYNINPDGSKNELYGSI